MPILCGSDLSPNSADALAAAIALAERRGDSELVLVHITAVGEAHPDLVAARGALSHQSDNVVSAVKIRLLLHDLPTKGRGGFVWEL